MIVLGVLLVVNSFQNNYVGFEKKLSDNCVRLSDSAYEIIDGDYLKTLDDLNICIVNKFCIDDRLIIEGYSNLIKDYVVINNQKVNVQISIADDIVLLGVPLIKNSF